MRNILFYGDSNTFGADPERPRRFGPDTRWPGVAGRLLGEGYSVIEEGLPGRTTVYNDPVMNILSGADYLYSCLYSHQPLDLAVIMLGTNDLKHRYGAFPDDVASGLERLVRIIRGFSTDICEEIPKIMLVSPPHIINPVGRFGDMFRGAEGKSRRLGPFVEELAEKHGCLYIDAARLIAPNSADGLHIDADAHRILGTAVAEKIKSAF